MPRFADVYVVEKRKPDGSLDLSDPQPPFVTATYLEITQHYFANREAKDAEFSDFGHGEIASQERIAAWYAAQGFRYRLKTW